jgi:hypothetical protein
MLTYGKTHTQNVHECIYVHKERKRESMYVHDVYTSIPTYRERVCACMYMNVYIYIERESMYVCDLYTSIPTYRERECVCMYMDVYIHGEREEEREYVFM